MRVNIAVVYDGEIVEDSLSISTSGTDPELAIGKDVKRMMLRAERTMALRYKCYDCSAPVGSPCQPEYGCTYDSRWKEGAHGTT
jgi:hypothetical protein